MMEKEETKLINSSYGSAIEIATSQGRFNVGQIKINFADEEGQRILFIDGIQGRKSKWLLQINKEGRPVFSSEERVEIRSKHNQKLNKEFEETHGSRWATFLIQKAIETAKKAGFSEVRILRPEHTPYYEQKRFETQEEAEKRQQRMKNMYYPVAKSAGFKVISGKRYMILKLPVEKKV